MNSVVAIFIGGGLGSVARYGVGKFAATWFPVSFPLGTLISNITSCLVLGLFLGYASLKPEQAGQYRLLITAGFCGGFSTFSSFSAETFELFHHHSYFAGILNIAANLFACLLAIGTGIWMMRLISN